MAALDLMRLTCARDASDGVYLPPVGLFGIEPMGAHTIVRYRSGDDVIHCVRVRETADEVRTIQLAAKRGEVYRDPRKTPQVGAGKRWLDNGVCYEGLVEGVATGRVWVVYTQGTKSAPALRAPWELTEWSESQEAALWTPALKPEKIADTVRDSGYKPQGLPYSASIYSSSLCVGEHVGWDFPMPLPDPVSFPS